MLHTLLPGLLRQVGGSLSARPKLAESLREVLESHEFVGAEELVLNACCLLTNLSFYHTPENQARRMRPGSLAGRVGWADHAAWCTATECSGQHAATAAGATEPCMLCSLCAQLFVEDPKSLLRHVTPLLMSDNEEAMVRYDACVGTCILSGLKSPL